MAESIAEAFERASEKEPVFTKQAPDSNPITDRQLRYAMVTVGKIVRQFDAPPPYSRADLYQEAMVKILTAIKRNPDLRYGWMGKAAYWACLSAIRKLRFRGEYSDRYQAVEWIPDLHETPTWDALPSEFSRVLEKLTDREKYTAVALSVGWTEEEIGNGLGVHPSNVYHYKKKIRNIVEPPEPKPQLCGNKIHVMEGANVYTRPNGCMTCVPCAQAARERSKLAKRRKKEIAKQF